MSKIECKNCKEKIDPNVKYCQHCGFPADKPENENLKMLKEIHETSKELKARLRKLEEKEKEHEDNDSETDSGSGKHSGILDLI
jgi:ribosomal protein L37E